MGVFRHQDCVTGQPTGSAVWLDGTCSSGKLQKGANISLGAVLGMVVFFISVKINCSHQQERKCNNKRLSKEHYKGGLVRFELYLATGYLVVSSPRAVR